MRLKRLKMQVQNYCNTYLYDMYFGIISVAAVYPVLHI